MTQRQTRGKGRQPTQVITGRPVRPSSSDPEVTQCLQNGKHRGHPANPHPPGHADMPSLARPHETSKIRKKIRKNFRKNFREQSPRRGPQARDREDRGGPLALAPAPGLIITPGRHLDAPHEIGPRPRDRHRSAAPREEGQPGRHGNHVKRVNGSVAAVLAR